MTIYNSDWRTTWSVLEPLVRRAHRHLTDYAEWLRDPAVDFWTYDAHVDGLVFGLREIVQQYTREVQVLTAFKNAHGALLQGWDPQARTALDGFLVSMPVIKATLDAIEPSYRDGQGRLVRMKVTMPDRITIATAIEGELQ